MRLIKPIRKNKYKQIISLGYNCEVAFRFLKYFKFEESSLFNWTFSYSINDLIYSINNIEMLGCGDFEGPNPLWECKNTHIRFHGKSKTNETNSEILNADKIDLIERIGYLKEKFLKTLKNDEKKLYIYKIKNEDISKDVEQKILNLKQALLNKGGNNFDLLIVSEKITPNSIPLNPEFIYRTVTNFANDNCATSNKYKNNGWNKIYKEFYVIPNKKKKKKKYKFEQNEYKEPLVSVIIPAYNHEKYVQETIKSIINQSYQNIELIIIDDGSVDYTWTKVNQLKEQCQRRFHRFILKTQDNEGTAQTLNKLISLAKGDYIYLIASDDIAKPEAIAKEVEFLEKNSDYALCVGDNEFIDEFGKKCFWDSSKNNIYDEINAKYKTFGKYLQTVKNINFKSKSFGSYRTLYFGNYIPNGYTIRRSALDIIPSFSKNAPLEDWYLMLQISKYFKMKYLDEILFSYRWHSSNSIKSNEKIAKITNQTFNNEKLMLEIANKTNTIINITKIQKDGILYKRQGIPFILELFTYNKLGHKIKVWKLLNIKIKKYEKRG